MGSYHKYLNRFLKSRVKKSLSASSPGIPITITNTSRKLTISMKATKARNIQIRLSFEESQQLNSKKKKDEKKRQILSKWNDTDSKLYTKIQKKECNEMNWKEKSKKKQYNFSLTIHHSYSFITLLSQQRC